MNRRTFTFASLASFAAATAIEPVAQADEPEANRPTGPLEGTWSGSVKDRVLTITLAVHNCGTESTQVLLGRGSKPGAVMSVWLVMDGENITLAEVAREVDTRELMSRMGPMPKYATLAAGQDVVIGTYAFTLPAGAERETIIAKANVVYGFTSANLVHRFDPADVPRG